MAFIRVKKIKGKDYAYLVESRWDPVKRTSRQRILKYLGPAREVKLDDVPPEHQDERVKAFILRNSVLNSHRRARLVLVLKERLLASILEGDVASTRAAAREGLKALGVDQLYVDVITPTMHDVGELWARREIYVSHEHLATNTMAQIMAELNDAITWTGRKRGMAIICTPDGERHKFAAQVLKGLLLNRGCEVLDISDSAPTGSTASFVEFRRPELVLISVTMSEHLPSVRRLIAAIQNSSPEVRVGVGGRAVTDGGLEDLPRGVRIAGPDTLGFLDRVVVGRS